MRGCRNWGRQREAGGINWVKLATTSTSGISKLKGFNGFEDEYEEFLTLAAGRRFKYRDGVGVEI